MIQQRKGSRIDINKASPTADDLVATVFSAAEALDKKDVPQDGRYLVCTPESYYTLIQSSRAVNFDFNQQGTNGSYKEGQIAKLAGFNILASNNIAQGNVTAPTGEQGYTFNGSDTTLSSVDMSETRMLAFQKSLLALSSCVISPCRCLATITMSCTRQHCCLLAWHTVAASFVLKLASRFTTASDPGLTHLVVGNMEGRDVLLFFYGYQS